MNRNYQPSSTCEKPFLVNVFPVEERTPCSAGALQIKKTAKRGAFRALLGSLPHIVIEAAKSRSEPNQGTPYSIACAVYHNQAAMSTPNLRMLKSDGVFFTFPPRHSACTVEPTEKRQRQGNEPTYDALDKLSESQARRSIIQAESVRRIPCRLRRKQATDRKKVKKTPSLFHQKPELLTKGGVICQQKAAQLTN